VVIKVLEELPHNLQFLADFIQQLLQLLKSQHLEDLRLLLCVVVLHIDD